jgi:purine-binding chemotaxis protein CheW
MIDRQAGPTLWDLPDDGAATAAAETALLLARARQLAGAPDGTGELAAQQTVECLLCRLGAEWYALEVNRLSAVQTAHGLSPLPCTPLFVAGLLNVRGTVVTVIDLARGLHLGNEAHRDDGLVLLTDCAAGGGAGQVGLLVDAIDGVRRLALDTLAPSLSGDPAVRGIAEGGVVVLDLAALLGDGRFEVFDEL